jgi:tetratricopeptide (TPR) repeat protein
VLLRLGEVQRAEEASRDAIRRAQNLDENKPTQPDQIVAYSIILNRLGRTDESIARLTAASRELHASSSGARALQADYNLARALMLTGRYDESQKLLDEVQRAWSENPTANKDRLGDLARTRAEIELARRRVNAAGELIDASLAQFGYPSKSNGLGLTAALTTASRIYLAKNQLPQAESFAQDALKISEGIARDPTQSADVGEAAFALAALQRAKGDRAAARANADRAVAALTNGLGGDHAITREAAALQAALHE